MEVTIGKTSGFCGGVQNVISKTEKRLDEEKKTIYCLGEIVHNRQVIEKLEKKGLKIVDNIEEVKDRAIIRAHGVTKEVYEKAKEKGIELIDLTCPKVLQIHKIAEEYAKNNYYIILIGVKNHPESVSTISFCGENSYLLEEKEEIETVIEKIKKSNLHKIFIIAQTTYKLTKFEEIVQEIKEKLKNEYEIEVKNTICEATRKRQEETAELSKKVDIMIIVGGKNSSNTKKLYDVAKENCKKAVLCETVEELDIQEIKKYEKVGIMAGASTPDEIVEEIKQKISK